MTCIADWLKQRGLILNAPKSQALVVPAGKLEAQPELDVWCHSTKLPPVSSARYLGVHIDSAMAWNTQMDRCVARLNKKVGVLWRMRRCFSMQSRIQYLKSVIMPDFSYGSNAFSASLAGKHLDRLQVLQNRAARAVYGRSPRTSARNLLVQLGAYRVQEIFIQKLIFLVWALPLLPC